MLRPRALVAILGIAALCAPLALAGGTWRSGNPPTLQSAQVDGKRRLVVTYCAPDGVTFGGSVYLDNDPKNATPASASQYGPIMYCNNISRCLGRWTLAPTPGSGPFTFTSDPLDTARFPAGTYYVQVETTNEDPYPSTRMWEFSNIGTVKITATGGSGGTGGGETDGSSAKPTGKLVTTVTLQGNGTVSYGTSSGVGVNKDVSSGPLPLYDMESLFTASRAIKLATKEGRLVVGPQSQLTMRERSGKWNLGSTFNELATKEYAGSAWFQGKNYLIVTTSSEVRSIGNAVFTIQTSIKGGDVVSAYQGKVAVKAEKKELVLTAGFQTFVRLGKPPAPLKKFKPPAKKFWQ
ncbi:MAG: hypothetical protein ACXVZL_10250 [Gaiellaceae bacterium]